MDFAPTGSWDQVCQLTADLQRLLKQTDAYDQGIRLTEQLHMAYEQRSIMAWYEGGKSREAQINAQLDGALEERDRLLEERDRLQEQVRSLEARIQELYASVLQWTALHTTHIDASGASLFGLKPPTTH